MTRLLASTLDNVKKIGDTVGMIGKKGWPQFAAGAVIGCSVFLLSGCGAAAEEQAKSDQTTQVRGYAPSDLQEIQVPLHDGRTVSCLIGTYKLFCFEQK